MSAPPVGPAASKAPAIPPARTSATRRSSSRRSTARTSLYSFTCIIAGSVLAFGTTLYVGNTAGQAGAGVFFQVMAYFSVATIACVWGADTALVRTLAAQLALGRAHESSRILRWAVVPVGLAGLLLAAAAWWGAPLLEGAAGAAAERAAEPGTVTAAVRVAAPFLAVSALLTVLFGALRGLGRVVEFTALQNVLLPALRLAAVVLVVGLGANLVSLSAAWSVPVAVTAVLAVLAVRRGARQAAHDAGSAGSAVPGTTARDTAAPPATARRFWSFASARGVSSLVEVVLEWIDVIAVAVFLGPAAAGVYGVVNRCVRLGAMLEHTARIVTGPLLSAALAVHDLPRARDIFSSTARFLVLSAWPFYLTLIVFAPTVLGFFGPGFAAGEPALQVISATMMLAVSAGGVQSMLLMGGRSRWQLANKSAALAVALVLNLWLVPAWGLMGAVTAWSAAVAVDYGMAALQVSYGMGIRAGWRTVVLPAALALAVFGGGGLAVRGLFGTAPAALLLAVAGGGAVYVGLAVLWRRPLGLEGLLADLRTRRPSRARR